MYYRVSQVYPWIAQDVDDSKGTSVDEMLKEILADCVTESAGPRMPLDEAGKTHLLDVCLREVLPICNGVAQAKSKTIEAKSCQVKENLEKYSGKRLENELYAPFVIAANTALLFLQELEVEDLRRGTDFICFHVLDPSVLVQDHKGRTSERKPDVIVVSEADAHNAHEGSAAEFGQHVFLLEQATQPKNTKFQWRNIRTFVEFKRHGSKNRMKPPPESYSIQPTPTETILPRESGTVSALPTALASSSANPPPPPVAPDRRSARQQEKSKETGSSNRKRTFDQFDPSESTSQSKRLKFSSEQQKGHDANVQAGGYAAELFATHVGRLHVFGLIIVGDMLYLWRYDREGAIQCSGFNFIQDLPRFLLLLLAMQRFEHRDWGLNTDIDPDFGELQLHKTTLTGAKDTKIVITLDLSDPDRFTHFGLNGRATNVFSVKCRNLSDDDDDDLVAKVFWPEAKRESEPDILKKVDDIAKQNDDVNGHVPEILWYKKFEDTSTTKIRERLGLPSQGSRVLYMIILRKLRPIHELTGNEFLQAWWATVKCHLALWRKGVYHRDVSESNLMYRKDKGRIVGVLNDFDLATTKETPTAQRLGIGTLPFLAMALLEDEDEDDQGRTEPLYEHDAESFVWVLIWISLQYSNGMPRNSEERPLDGWLGVDATQCRKEKSDFLFSQRRWNLSAGEGHERSWELAKKCIYALNNNVLNRANGPLQPLDVDTAFKTLLYDPFRPFLPSVASP